MKASVTSLFRGPGRGGAWLSVSVMAFLWWVLLNDLRVEWTVNPQYKFGWAVPFICALLLVRNFFHAPSRISTPESTAPRLPAVAGRLVLCVLAFLYLPTRLIQEANPDWRLVSWTLAAEVIGLTFFLLRPVASVFRLPLSGFRFPILFFLVAVPWPSLIEMPVIQSLTRLDVGITTELAGWFGIPAIPHGNVIEVATGVVDIDEACSGIRSFQATLMISLFLGEWLRLRRGRRVALVLAGFLFSLLFNLARLMLLVWVASRDGIAAVNRWHDSAGVMILLGCFFGLWFLAHALAAKKPQPATGSLQLVAPPPEISACRFPLSALVVLSAWILFVEIGVEAWYRVHEARLPAVVAWNIAWPANPTMKAVPLTTKDRRILRFDAGQHRYWQAEGCSWQAIFLRWNPGSVAARLTANHTPEVCLSCEGYSFTGRSGLQLLTTHGLQLPFRFYQVGGTTPPVFVAYCLWEDRAARREFSTALLGWGNRLAPALAGQRNPGQRSLEIAVSGVGDLAAAQAAVQKLLDEMVSVNQ